MKKIQTSASLVRTEERRSLDWENLRYFIAFAQQGSLSAAARQVGVDHATIARRIEALEQSLRIKLVDRRTRSYVLTDDGKRIADAGERMSEEAFLIERIATASQPGVSGDVVASVPPALSVALIAPRLGDFYKAHPALTLELVASTSDASLARREADIALRLRRPAEAELVARKARTIEFGLYASAAYINTTEPKAYGFIAYDASMENSPQQAWLRLQARERPVVFRSNDLVVQAVAASSGAGIAALPDFLASMHGLIAVSVRGAPLRRDAWLAVHRDVRMLPRIRATVDFLYRCLNDS